MGFESATCQFPVSSLPREWDVASVSPRWRRTAAPSLLRRLVVPC
jgi:hypothetical protein